MSNSVVRHPCIALCARRPRSHMLGPLFLWETPYCGLCSWVFLSDLFVRCFLFYIPHVSGIAWLLTSSGWCFSLGTLHPCRPQRWAVLHLSSRLSESPRYTCLTSSSASHLSKDTLVMSTSCPLWMLLGYIHTFTKKCFQIFFGGYPQEGLLGHPVVLFLIFWGTSIMFSKVAAPVSNPTRGKKSSPGAKSGAWKESGIT